MRALQRVSDDGRPTPSDGARMALDVIQRLDLFKHITNGIGLLAVLFYAVNFSNVMASDNHIYAVYQLFPVLASLAITTTLWTAPANSLLRVLYIVGLYTISWLGV